MRIKIDSSARVSGESRLAEDVEVGPYAIIEDGVEVGAGSYIASHAIVRRGTILGAGCHIDSFAVVGGLPQDLRFDAKTVSGVRLGDRVVIREGTTVHRSTQAGGFTEVGNRVFLMANSHVAHDCHVGDDAILANGVLLGGHVSIGAHAFIGGSAIFHQFSRVGESAMVGGGAQVSRDVPPFCMVAQRDGLIGLNLVGLKRRGFSREEIQELKEAWHRLYESFGNVREKAVLAREAGLGKTRLAAAFLDFFAVSKRGFAQRRSDEG